MNGSITLFGLNAPRIALVAFVASTTFLTGCDNSANMSIEQTYPIYQGNDLGLSFNGQGSVLKVWSPMAEAMALRIYANDLPGDEPLERIDMRSAEGGIWMAELEASHLNSYYSVSAKIDGAWRAEVPGPYAKAVGTNGLRGHVVNPQYCNPDGWEADEAPLQSSFADIILYELHIRDFSIHPESGHIHKGKFLAFTERGTQTPEGLATGIDHLVELGVTHVHLLPAFDFLSIDESKPNVPQYNWGYDPQNFNVPEGSYSSNPADGAVRIKEFKTMVKALHDAGLRVVMDVVYNHTGKVEGLSFDALVPGYYYRYREDGTMSNASGCGNETASDQPMMRKFMIESLEYWMEEYHIDGFRFDLMAVHDITTMNEIEKALRKIRPDVFIYGEGWTADDSTLPVDERALKAHIRSMPGIAAFSDDIRDGLKGGWSQHDAPGFVGGMENLRESVKFGIVGAVEHTGVDYENVNNSKGPWALEPTQCIAYVSCHDNHTLYDRLLNAHPDAVESEIVKMHILANTVVLTSQAVPFLHAGVEFMRSKGGEENSYQSPDSVNQIDWSRKGQYPEVLKAYKDLIALRKAHPAFRLGSGAVMIERLTFLPSDASVIAYTIQAPEGDAWAEVVLAFNGGDADMNIDLPDGEWELAWRGSASFAGAETLSGTATIPRKGSVIAFKKRK
jgi:pullulanase